MKNQNAAFLKQLVNKIIVNDYNNDYYQFKKENNNLEIFMKNYCKKYNKKKVDLKHLNISSDDYDKILIDMEKASVNNKQDEIRIYHVISNDIQFISIHDININVLSSNNRKIYDEAIQIINHKYHTDNVLIGIKNNDLLRMIKDEQGNVKSWIVKKKGIIVSNKDDNGDNSSLSVSDDRTVSFSNVLIISFIIGSFIGILFLSLYVKFMK